MQSTIHTRMFRVQGVGLEVYIYEERGREGGLYGDEIGIIFGYIGGYIGLKLGYIRIIEGYTG